VSELSAVPPVGQPTVYVGWVDAPLRPDSVPRNLVTVEHASVNVPTVREHSLKGVVPLDDRELDICECLGAEGDGLPALPRTSKYPDLAIGDDVVLTNEARQTISVGNRPYDR
jgi:hypothetical protein